MPRFRVFHFHLERVLLQAQKRLTCAFAIEAIVLRLELIDTRTLYIQSYRLCGYGGTSEWHP